MTDLGDAWADMLADAHVILLRTVARLMADDLDRHAMRDVEGVREWRSRTAKRGAA